ncbi:putative Ulp1 protease family protein [Rosellinia necatrix]|uniref:Putative Ulp1 protease family protein n=1 Tax=Rosellinia necatrix TaxID=77044 RepID=A0A1S7ULF0_ROSNE|nr:putative Ulp1 protease family protein [Rosellinia necatrix]
MPSAQQGLPAETGEGSGVPAFSLPGAPFGKIVNILKGLWPARLNDMPKPANVGAPRPMNSLKRSASSHPPRGISSPSRPVPVPEAPPPAKRQRFNESRASNSHTQATFVYDGTAGTASPRNQSIESPSIPDSQRSAASNMSGTRPELKEYRAVDQHTKPKRARTNRSSPRQLRHDDDDDDDGDHDVESSRPRPNLPSKSDEDSTDDEIHLINPQGALSGAHQPKRKRSEEKPILDLADRFRPKGATLALKRAIDNTEKGKRNRRQDSSPDELAPSSEEIATRSIKRPRHLSPSLSKKGNIMRTSFVDVRSSTASSSNFQLIDKHKEEADLIIGAGLRILRGTCGKYQYQAGFREDPDPCFMSTRELGHTLFPVDQEGNILKSYRYLTVDLKEISHIVHTKDNKEGRIVAISQRMCLTNGAGAKLIIEFASPPELDKFLQWVNLYSPSFYQIIKKPCNEAKLEKDFDEMIQRAPSHRIVPDAELAMSTADDIRVIQHNRNNRGFEARIDPSLAAEAKTRPKLRDAMSSTVSGPSGDDVAPNQSWGDGRVSVSRQVRTTRSTFAYMRSPEPDPEPIGWTLLNAGWDRQWRNSLVYPNTGKNRATVDKDDIQRLDEGQFLNDNIIIFYLRYLQKNLEAKDEGLAKRIYFQNTFFYDKLKPTKTGQGINYDSVKTWTSKADLFSKDYIIVPINEYTHWYVAIICNAPRLLPSSDSYEELDDMQIGVTAIPNSIDITQQTSKASLQNGISNGDPDGGHALPPTQEDVVENLRRMSIDSNSSPLSGENKQKPDDAEGETASALIDSAHEVYVIKDSDRPDTEVEHIATTTNPRARKGAGRRKCDPNQPRIITLDSLGAPHSPTCNYLKQYLVAELRDKRGVDIPVPGSMGFTAKGIPEQTNHCDCGLFLLGYIQEFLLDPDAFVKSILHRDTIHWQLDPSKLRSNIRDLIFDLQKEQQRAEDAIQERKRQAKISKSTSAKAKVEGTSSHITAPTLSLHCAPSNPELAAQDNCSGRVSENTSSPTLSNSRPSSARGNSATPGESMAPKNSPASRSKADRAMTEAQTPAHSTESHSSRTTRRTSTVNDPDIEEFQSRPKSAPHHLVASPRRIELAFDHQSHHHIPSTSPISPSRGRNVAWHSPSPGTDGSTNIPREFVQPLLSETPSSKGSRGATPQDPVVVDDSDNNKRKGTCQSPRPHGGVQLSSRIVVEIASANAPGAPGAPPSSSSKTDVPRQTGYKSSYFAGRQEGEELTGAKLREKPQNDIIDLSDD